MDNIELWGFGTRERANPLSLSSAKLTIESRKEEKVENLQRISLLMDYCAKGVYVENELLLTTSRKKRG